VEQLLDAVSREQARKGVQDASELTWTNIAKSVGGRSGKQCREKYKVSAVHLDRGWMIL